MPGSILITPDTLGLVERATWSPPTIEYTLSAPASPLAAASSYRAWPSTGPSTAISEIGSYVVDDIESYLLTF